ncbi:MAG: LysE family transporter [bacterium]|nr:LysE family transporter [bacterium]
MPATAWGFLLGWVASMPIAGAVSIFIAQRGLAGWWRNGLAMATGSAIIEGTWCLFVLAGATQILDRWPVVGDIARWAGGGVLVCLGFYFLRRHTSLPTAGRLAASPRRSLVADLRNGAVLVAMNPLVPVNWLALVTAATALGLDPDVSPPLFAGGVVLGVFSWFATMLWVISSVRHRLSARQIDRVMHVLGAILVLTGVLVVLRQATHL